MLRHVAATLAGVALALAAQAGHAFGQEGHSIVAEIAQRRLDPAAQAAVTRLLDGSMASTASWADGLRNQRPDTSRWHFVNMPRKQGDAAYDPALYCKTTGEGDCVVAELQRLRTQLACSPSADERRDALKFAIHLVGDIHQPLHTVDEIGGNGQAITGLIHGATCGKDGCEQHGNLHSFWDTGLIRLAYYDWGAYVDKLEATTLKDRDVQLLGQVTDPVTWALQTHAVAPQIWSARLPVDTAKNAVVLDDEYYKQALPLLDRQLALAGLRLAAFLNEAYDHADCAIPPQTNLGELKEALKAYAAVPPEGGKSRYQLAQAQVAGDALKYLQERLAQGVSKPAIVLDIDETSLDNLAQMKINDFGYIRLGPCSMKEGEACASEGWEQSPRATATAIAPTLALVKAALDNKVAVFFVTGRRESKAERAGTALNLKKAGFDGYTALYLRPQDSKGPVSDFKAGQRASIETQGYRILVNIGDQQSDLAGGHAERGFKMPNPFYYIP